VDRRRESGERRRGGAIEVKSTRDGKIMRHPFIVFSVASLLASCSFDETPADINQRLIPKIAEELIAKQNSKRVQGITSEIRKVLKEHEGEGITYKVGAPDLNGETGVRFYSQKNQRQFLAIALNLRASRDSYNVGGVSESSE
jgi:hypothetical protein